MTRTTAQKERQRHRDHGKYAKVNPCYKCGQSAGMAYCSAQGTDSWLDDEGLVLCAECCETVDAMPRDQQRAWLLDGVMWKGR